MEQGKVTYNRLSMKKFNILFLLCIILFQSCSDMGETMLPPSNGKLSHVLVVMEKNKWKYAPGDTIRATLRHFYSGLPQEEPIFDVSQIPKEALSDIFRRNKNIILANISQNVKKSSVKIAYNRWASPQVIITIDAKNNAEFVKIYGKNSRKITEILLNTERERLVKTYTKLKEKLISQRLIEKYGIDLSVPSGFQIYHDTLNFMWIRRESSRLSQVLLVWDYPYKDTADLTANRLVGMRDSMTIKFIPGPVDNSFMTTEKRFTFDFTEHTIKNKYIAEMRGLWKLEGYPMGGPFMSFSMVDEKRGKIITVDAFVYAGKQDKRNFIKQMEAILYSISFPEKENKK